MSLKPEDLTPYTDPELLASAMRRASAAYARGSFALARAWAREAQALAREDRAAREQAGAIVARVTERIGRDPTWGG